MSSMTSASFVVESAESFVIATSRKLHKLQVLNQVFLTRTTRMIWKLGRIITHLKVTT